MATRIQQTFDCLRLEGRAALVTYMMAGDPDYKTALEIMCALPDAGSDIIELGLPFSDPMADGPTIQAAGLRALKAGQTVQKTLALVADFRQYNHHTPIVLMGYYNPIYQYGVMPFLQQAKNCGIDGLLIVDLPPEMDNELCLPAHEAGLDFIRLATPTTNEKRLQRILKNNAGFVYYVSMTGITGTSLVDTSDIGTATWRIKQHTDLPVAVGFGIKTAAQVTQIAKVADGVVVGSALINILAATLDEQARATGGTVAAVVNLVKQLRVGLTQD